ncbi:MAG: SDR family oxidoreductase [Chlamydiota bacterium]
MHDNKTLSGQVAVVSGGGRGIGAAIAATLAELGAQVVICGRTGSTLESTAQRLRAAGHPCEAVECDVTMLASVEKLAQRVEQVFGRTDILVNNAGVGGFATPLHKLPPEEWERTLNTNLRGVYYMIRSFAPLMIRGGKGDIINISSGAGKNPLPNGAAYAASKWGLNGLSYSIAEELRNNHIRVSVICPGSVQTELGPHAGKDASKMLQPEDVAHVVGMMVTQAPRAFASEVFLRPTQKP